MRKALVIGIDYYPHIGSLRGCIKDAKNVEDKLSRNEDGTVNFSVKLILGSSQNIVRHRDLKSQIRNLFEGDGEIALLYFAGHGSVESTGGYLCGGDCETSDDGVALSEVITMANKSPIQNRVIILDSCHSGIAGGHPLHETTSEIGDGVTILTASTADQYACEEQDSGVFTTLLVDALGGSAANLVGEITPGSVYAHIDQSLGPWSQRPVFKTNVKRFVSLRKVQPPLPLEELRCITDFFPKIGYQFQLGPEYEPERPEASGDLVQPDPEKTATFAILQKYNRLNLLVPEGAPHMWHAAMQSKSVRLTALGEHYRRLVSNGLI